MSSSRNGSEHTDADALAAELRSVLSKLRRRLREKVNPAELTRSHVAARARYDAHHSDQNCCRENIAFTIFNIWIELRNSLEKICNIGLAIKKNSSLYDREI